MIQSSHKNIDKKGKKIRQEGDFEMSKNIPQSVAKSSLMKQLQMGGLILKSQGKVRDIYEMPEYHDVYLMVTTDRVSIFDFVLGSNIPQKGEVLAAMTVFWDEFIGNELSMATHLVAYGSEIDFWLPPELQNNRELQKRALLVDKKKIIPIEAIVRGNLTKNRFGEYQEHGTVCGVKLAEGLKIGSEIRPFLFTPSTKEENDHDRDIDAMEVNERYGNWISAQSLDIFGAARKYAESKGILIVDTKFEWSKDRILVDEFLTPDSSRYWILSNWIESMESGKVPEDYDKEPLRNWGRRVETPWGIGINNLDPTNPEHVNFVGGLEIPREIQKDILDRYKTILALITGMSLSDYQNKEMYIE